MSTGALKGRPQGARAMMEAHLIELEEIYAPVQRAVWHGIPGLNQARLHYDARDPDCNAAILHKPIQTRLQYLGALHEFGHLHHLRNGTLYQVPLVDEPLAWLWAFENSRLPLTANSFLHADGCLWGYLIDAVQAAGIKRSETNSGRWGELLVPEPLRPIALEARQQLAALGRTVGVDAGP